MGGTLTRDEWLKLQEGERERAMAPRGPGNVVISLAQQMTERQRLGDFSNEEDSTTSSGTDASQHQSDQ